MRDHDGTDEELHTTVKRIIIKCKNLTHVVIHGLDMPLKTAQYLRNLPTTTKNLDLSGNEVIMDMEIKPLFKTYPDMESIDLSGMAITIKTLERMAERWGNTLTNITLPQTIARELTLYKDSPDCEKVGKLKEWIGKMVKLRQFRIGEWQHGMETKIHRSFRGEGSLGHRMEQTVVHFLKTVLPPTVTVNMNPYVEEDEMYYRTDTVSYYEKYGVPKPNPNFPRGSDPKYVFQTLGRVNGGGTGRGWTYRDHYMRSNYMGTTRDGPREYYLEYNEPGGKGLAEWSDTIQGGEHTRNGESPEEWGNTEDEEERIWDEEKDRAWTNWDDLI